MNRRRLSCRLATMTAIAGFIIIAGLSGCQKEHTLEPGNAFQDNPLKGFMPYHASATDFPHSLEWFYLPLSDFYPKADMTPDSVPDFTSLERELSVIAKRGCQAVFRVYLDYPTESFKEQAFGIPAFLLKAPYNLKTFSYTEFDNKASKCPDYTNEALQKTIINFIGALGNKYDGDPRVGFITAGLLGFWGEWHTWPYDNDNAEDTLPNWTPSDSLFDDVTVAFENSFKTTRILFRYPKGKNQNNSALGFHDDSWCFETVYQSMGGNDWNFFELLKNAKPNCEKRWETAPIGGELRPEIQEKIFTSTPWIAGPDAPAEKWDTDLELGHPSWLLNEQIKFYKGDALANAVKASNQMGYTFRVTKALYDDITDYDNISVTIKIINTGVAPFYYTNKLWPIYIGLKQNGTIAKSWKTEWDISTVLPGSKEISFRHTIKNEIIPSGNYTLCIKVKNPLENGRNLGFANKSQNNDGWLELGSITIK